MRRPTVGRWLPGWALATALAAFPAARGQDAGPPPLVERLKELDEPGTLKEKLEREKEKKQTRPPFEFFRSQVAPFDVTAYVKPNHWSTLYLEMRANAGHYDGLLQTAPVPLMGMPQAVVYRREARLVKDQPARLGLQMMLPQSIKELGLDLLRPEAIRPDGGWPASLLRLEPHQMLILMLAKEPGDYMSWRKMRAMQPPPRLDSPGSSEDRLYYRMAFPLDPMRPALSPHPLTWTTISHVFWDSLPPEALNPSQQQAMVDWLHWGGQLIVVAGAGPTLAPLRDSFLARYLPADPSGENVGLTHDDLRPLADAYPPPNRTVEPPIPRSMLGPDSTPEPPPEPPAPAETIRVLPQRPIYLTGLRPREGATPLPLGPGSEHLLGAEWRVGRGRVTMLAINPTEPALAAWSGLDTMVRRVILRRPEEARLPDGTAAPLAGPELSWVRYLGRDLGASVHTSDSFLSGGQPVVIPPGGRPWAASAPGLDLTAGLPQDSVAAWLDSAEFPTTCRTALENASGISIPGRPFVLRIVLAYAIALVPLNWVLCRYLLGRREWAWAVVPVLALGFAVAVERGAANEQGFDSASDEIDLLEVEGGYPRAHLNRVVALYSTGRVRYSISYPGDPIALALPLNTESGLRGDEVSQSVWSSWPTPTLEGFSVQPRSLGMFRAEQMVDLRGAIALDSSASPRRVSNRTDTELRDAVLVEPGAGPIPLGTIPPGGSAPIEGGPGPAPTRPAWTDPGPFLNRLREYDWGRPEDRGEVRLVAWADGARPKQVISPAVDRARGLTLVVVHLKHGPPPTPDGPPYAAGMANATNPGAEAGRR